MSYTSCPFISWTRPLFVTSSAVWIELGYVVSTRCFHGAYLCLKDVVIKYSYCISIDSSEWTVYICLIISFIFFPSMLNDVIIRNSYGISLGSSEWAVCYSVWFQNYHVWWRRPPKTIIKWCSRSWFGDNDMECCWDYVCYLLKLLSIRYIFVEEFQFIIIICFFLNRQTPPSPRFDHAAILHAERYLFIFGGCSHSVFYNDLHVLDLETVSIPSSICISNGSRITFIVFPSL